MVENGPTFSKKAQSNTQWSFTEPTNRIRLTDLSLRVIAEVDFSMCVLEQVLVKFLKLFNLQTLKEHMHMKETFYALVIVVTQK